MAKRVVLHVGSMKSGTSFLQNVLGANRQRLAEQGLLFPGARWKSQVAAVQDVIVHGGEGQPALATDGPWATLAAEINDWPGTAVVSMEFLGPRTPDQIERIGASFPGADLGAVLSARDLGRQIPAMWLESVQNGSVTGWEDFLNAVRTEDKSSSAGRNFWRHQAIPAMARRWDAGLGRGSVTLLTVPRPGSPPGLLWERFATIIGVEPGGVDLEVRANPSIGLATAQVMVRLNRRLQKDDGTQPASYDKFVKHVLAKRGLVARQGVEPRLGLDAAWVMTRGANQVRRLASDGHRVVGDLEELRPAPVPGIHADDVDLEAELEAAVDGLAHLVQEWANSDRRKRRQARRAVARRPT